ncbi:unnamed protein product, partial [Urochloa humidicola]
APPLKLIDLPGIDQRAIDDSVGEHGVDPIMWKPVGFGHAGYVLLYHRLLPPPPRQRQVPPLARRRLR